MDSIPLSPPIQKWFQKQGLPTIIRGYPHEGITLPYIDEDWKAAAFHAGNQLLANGHTEIALLVPDLKLQGLKATEEGLRKALESENQDAKVHIVKENREVQGVIHSLNHALAQHTGITALVITRPRHLLNTITWLATHSLRIPAHLSIVALCHESWFSEITPTITHYKISHTKMANALARRLNNLLKNISLDSFEPTVIPEQEKGQSIKKLN